ncbi:MAG: type II secretion system protein [Planctomycetota bacterium]|nr:MAG: type II secretion system protein [Planctomycetota bacterium]
MTRRTMPRSDEDAATERRSFGVGGFTLVELLVAMALMTILTGSVVFIFMEAQNIFVTVDARVQVYQYARYAFDQMERDLANVVKTMDMEFYNDQPANALGVKGHYNPGEAIPIRGTDNRIGDPLGGDQIYNRAFTLRQPEPYQETGGQQFKHRRDSVYFKSVTVIGGQTKNALVEYALVDVDKERPRLVKRIWHVTGVDASNPLAPRLTINDDPQALPIVQDLCLYAVDAKFEVFVKNRRRSDPGDYYEASELVNPPRSPRAGNPRVFEPLPNARGWTGGNSMIQTYYDQTWNGGAFPDTGILEPGTDSLPPLFHTIGNFEFPMLKEGDKIFLRDPGTPPKLKAQEYTIKAFVLANTDPPQPWTPDSPRQSLRIQFEEKIDTNGRRVERIQYLGAWVPSGLRVTLRIKDAKSRQPRTVSRVFKIQAN